MSSLVSVLTRSARLVTSRAPAKRVTPAAALRCAASAAIEGLEGRRLFALSIGVDGTSDTVLEGQDYPVTLSATGADPATFDGWKVQWGDGSPISPLIPATAGADGNVATAVSHAYPDNDSYDIAVWAVVNGEDIPASTASQPGPTDGELAADPVNTRHGFDYNFVTTGTADGGFVAAGMVNDELALQRFDADGVLIGTTTPTPGTAGLIPIDIATNADGITAVTGLGDAGLFLALYDEQGAPVVNGPFTGSLGFASAAGYAVAFNGGHVYVAGYGSDGSGNSDYIVARFDATTGQHDASWGSAGGVAVASIGSSDAATGMAFLAGGRIAVGGMAGGAAIGAVVIDADGVGYTATSELVPATTSSRVAVDAAGGILVAASATGGASAGNSLIVARYELSAGTLALDPDFGAAGVARADVGETDASGDPQYIDSLAFSLTVDPTFGDILVGGSAQYSANNNKALAIARFTAGGETDATIFTPLGTDARVEYLRPSSDGSLVVAGNVNLESPDGSYSFGLAKYAPGTIAGGGTAVAAQITNANPVAGASALQAVGGSVTVTGSVTDPGSADTFAGQAITVRDASGAVVASGTGSTLTFTPAAGTYTATFSVSDDDGGHATTSTEFSVSADTSTAAFTATAGVDEISLVPVEAPAPAPLSLFSIQSLSTTTSAGQVKLVWNGVTVGTFSADERIRIVAGSGDDTIDLSASTVAAEVFGGAGNDTLTAGAAGALLAGEDGADVLLGGAGADAIRGGDGADLLVGGAGSDTLGGGAGEDILVAGYTRFTQFGDQVNPAEVLRAIAAEWRRTDITAAERFDHIHGTAGGLNGSYFLKNDGGNQTVFDDTAADLLSATDYLSGGEGNDVLFYNFKQGGTLDVVDDSTRIDVRRDLDLT